MATFLASPNSTFNNIKYVDEIFLPFSLYPLLHHFSSKGSLFTVCTYLATLCRMYQHTFSPVFQNFWFIPVPFSFFPSHFLFVISFLSFPFCHFLLSFPFPFFKNVKRHEMMSLLFNTSGAAIRAGPANRCWKVYTPEGLLQRTLHQHALACNKGPTYVRICGAYKSKGLESYTYPYTFSSTAGSPESLADIYSGGMYALGSQAVKGRSLALAGAYFQQHPGRRPFLQGNSHRLIQWGCQGARVVLNFRSARIPNGRTKSINRSYQRCPALTTYRCCRTSIRTWGVSYIAALTTAEILWRSFLCLLLTNHSLQRISWTPKMVDRCRLNTAMTNFCRTDTGQKS